MKHLVAVSLALVACSSTPKTSTNTDLKPLDPGLVLDAGDDGSSLAVDAGGEDGGYRDLDSGIDGAITDAGSAVDGFTEMPDSGDSVDAFTPADASEPVDAADADVCTLAASADDVCGSYGLTGYVMYYCSGACPTGDTQIESAGMFEYCCAPP